MVEVKAVIVPVNDKNPSGITWNFENGSDKLSLIFSERIHQPDSDTMILLNEEVEKIVGTTGLNKLAAFEERAESIINAINNTFTIKCIERDKNFDNYKSFRKKSAEYNSSLQYSKVAYKHPENTFLA